jgi:hypothetical protein
MTTPPQPKLSRFDKFGIIVAIAVASFFVISAIIGPVHYYSSIQRDAKAYMEQRSASTATQVTNAKVDGVTNK